MVQGEGRSYLQAAYFQAGDKNILFFLPGYFFKLLSLSWQCRHQTPGLYHKRLPGVLGVINKMTVLVLVDELLFKMFK